MPQFQSESKLFPRQRAVTFLLGLIICHSNMLLLTSIMKYRDNRTPKDRTFYPTSFENLTQILITNLRSVWSAALLSIARVWALDTWRRLSLFIATMWSPTCSVPFLPIAPVEVMVLTTQPFTPWSSDSMVIPVTFRTKILQDQEPH